MLIDRETPQMEAILKRVIARHGLANVQAELARMMPGMKWDQWQRLQESAERISQKITNRKNNGSNTITRT